VTHPTEFLVHIATLLERLGIPYHVGGSVARLGVADLLDRARHEVADL